MGRTTIEIDDVLVARVMRRYRLPSKRATVDLALRPLATEGSGWSGDLGILREPDDVASQ